MPRKKKVIKARIVPRRRKLRVLPGQGRTCGRNDDSSNSSEYPQSSSRSASPPTPTASPPTAPPPPPPRLSPRASPMDISDRGENEGNEVNDMDLAQHDDEESEEFNVLEDYDEDTNSTDSEASEDGRPDLFQANVSIQLMSLYLL